MQQVKRPLIRRELPGKITREAPPGTGMTADQFREALQSQADDAARWRWVRRNLMSVILDWPVENMTGGDFQARVDKARRETA